VNAVAEIVLRVELARGGKEQGRHGEAIELSSSLVAVLGDGRRVSTAGGSAGELSFSPFLIEWESSTPPEAETTDPVERVATHAREVWQKRITQLGDEAWLSLVHTLRGHGLEVDARELDQAQFRVIVSAAAEAEIRSGDASS
jgi:hypothetical protein